MNPSHASLPSVVFGVAKPPSPAPASEKVPLAIPACVLLLGVILGWGLGVLLFGGFG